MARRNDPKFRQMRCPNGQCDGELWLGFTTDSRVVSGWNNDALPRYRCHKCSLAFEITNPNSFLPWTPSASLGAAYSNENSL